MRCFILALVLACFVFHSDAQEERRVRVGFNLGPGLSTIMSDNAFTNQQNQWRFRFHASVFQDFLIKKPFYIQTELNYSAMGTMQFVNLYDSIGNNIGRGAYKYNLHYIQIPVLAKFKFGKSIKGYVALGTYIGFLVSAKGGIDASDSGSDQYPVINIIDDYTTFDTGLKFHTGIEIPVLNEQRILIEGRYTQGFLDISDATSRDWNGGFSLMVAYMFEL